MTTYVTPAELEREALQQISIQVYASFAALNQERGDGFLIHWLASRGHISLSKCPRCQEEYFNHKAQCSLGEAIAVSLLATVRNRIFFAKD